MRTAWFLAGVGASAYAMVRARRAAELLTPEGLGDRVAGLSVGWQIFAEELRAGMAESETELRRRLVVGLDEQGLLAAAQQPTPGRHRRIAAATNPPAAVGTSTTSTVATDEEWTSTDGHR